VGEKWWDERRAGRWAKRELDRSREEGIQKTLNLVSRFRVVCVVVLLTDRVVISIRKLKSGAKFSTYLVKVDPIQPDRSRIRQGEIKEVFASFRIVTTRFIDDESLCSIDSELERIRS
jgi:hypothetical protein